MEETLKATIERLTVEAVNIKEHERLCHKKHVELCRQIGMLRTISKKADKVYTYLDKANANHEEDLKAGLDKTIPLKSSAETLQEISDNGLK